MNEEICECTVIHEDIVKKVKKEMLDENKIIGLITKNNYLLINFLPDIINPKEYIFKRFDLFKNNSIV